MGQQRNHDRRLVSAPLPVGLGLARNQVAGGVAHSQVGGGEVEVRLGSLVEQRLHRFSHFRLLLAVLKVHPQRGGAQLPGGPLVVRLVDGVQRDRGGLQRAAGQGRHPGNLGAAGGHALGPPTPTSGVTGALGVGLYPYRHSRPFGLTVQRVAEVAKPVDRLRMVGEQPVQRSAQ